MIKKTHGVIAVCTVLALGACEDATLTDEALEGLEMCRTAALDLIEGSGAVEFPSSFHDPYRDPSVVRLRYEIKNSGTRGTIRCYFDEEDLDNRRFVRITLDDVDIAPERLGGLTTAARSAWARKNNS